MAVVFGGKCLFLLFLFTPTARCQTQSCSSNLTNTVVYEGTLRVSFKRLNNSQPVQWAVYPSSDFYNLQKNMTNYDDVVVSPFNTTYAVNASGLMIFNSTVTPQGSSPYATAGLYILRYRNPNCTYGANLIVIRSGPWCSSNASDPNNAKLLCGVDFAESSVQPNNPVFTWKNGDSVVMQQQPVPSQINTYLKRSTSSLVISSNDATTFECQLTFNSTPKSPFNYVTSTAPDFTASCIISNPLAQSCSSNLTNTVTYEGSPASFSRVDNSQSVQWSVVSSSDIYGAQKIITNYDDVVVSPFNTTYAVTPSGLTIFNSTVAPQGSIPYATAGLYYIRYRNPNCTYAANLIVIRKGPVCSYDASDQNNVKLLCSVDYAAAYTQPNYLVFTWRNSTSVVKQILPISSALGSGLRRSTSQLSIDRSDVTIYECQLTFNSTPKSPLNYVTSTAPNFTASCFVSRDVSVVPTYGPAAGGTVVTVVAKWMALENVSISAVYIGQNLRADINRTSTENVLATTPAIENETQINQQLPIILEISPTSTNISTGDYFTYKPNPTIYDVIPKELLISGGIRLNISGTSLDSVAQPLVRAAVIIRKRGVITYNNQSFSSCFQPTQNGTQMICLSPPIYIRDDFQQQLFGQINPYSISRGKREAIFSYGWIREDRSVLHDASPLSIRSKRSAYISTNQTYTLPGSEDQMEIYVGIIFDGFKRYENNSLVDNGGRFSVCTISPTFKCEGHIAFDDNTITIQGSNLTQCYRQSDYNVSIGNGFCAVKSLTDNALKCHPPEEKPQQTENDINYNCGEDFAVIVELGFQVYSCSCLKYPNDDHTKLIIIIAATVGSFVVVLVIIAVIVVVVKRAKKAKMVASHREFRENRLGEDSYTMSDHQLRIDERSTPEYNNRVTYRRQIDTIYVSSTPGVQHYTNAEQLL